MKSRNTIIIAAVAALLTGAAFLSGGENTLLLKNAHILPVVGEELIGDILIRDGKIAKIGSDIPVSAETEILDMSGKWVMPGIIDSHAHIAVEGGVNELGNLITAEVDVRDIINPEDIYIFYALTGGVTTVHTMHGSANPIAGRGVVLKLRWGKSAEEMIFQDAPLTVKWALGENPKQTNFVLPGQSRYPKTRMGVEASIRKAFDEARDYMRTWEDYQARLKPAKKSGSSPLPPRRDYRLEVIADILRGKYWVRCHGYQSEEMLSIMRLCREYGVKLVCFEHGLEGYRIADELADGGVAVSTFADFWSFKWEGYQTMPQAAALMAQRGVLTAINSDDAERMRRLFHEAAKTIRFGGLSEIEALETITLNPAKFLGIDRWTGTIEEGKDADLAVFSRHPFDPYTICEMTLVDGTVYFDRAEYLEKRKKAEEEQARQDAEKKAEKDKSPRGEV